MKVMVSKMCLCIFLSICIVLSARSVWVHLEDMSGMSEIRNLDLGAAPLMNEGTRRERKKPEFFTCQVAEKQATELPQVKLKSQLCVLGRDVMLVEGKGKMGVHLEGDEYRKSGLMIAGSLRVILRFSWSTNSMMRTKHGAGWGIP